MKTIPDLALSLSLHLQKHDIGKQNPLDIEPVTSATLFIEIEGHIDHQNLEVAAVYPDGDTVALSCSDGETVPITSECPLDSGKPAVTESSFRPSA